MAYNIGLDFGTTYSVISRLRGVVRDKTGNIEEYRVEACLPSENAQSPCQDSIVLKNLDDTLTFGPLAKERTGRKGTVLYKGFKMMLAEEDGEVLASRGYNEQWTPKKIVEVYLNDLLKNHLYTNGLGVDVIDKIVIGVPEIWFSEVSTLDCRTALEGIVESFPYVKSVELVSEPAAACAFFVENYKKTTKEQYEGKILLIDYGGGTLDIALCDVRENGQCSEVSVIKRCGAGLNEEGYIGKAGLAFLEAIVKIALENSDFSETEIIENRDFYRCINSVELALMNQIGDIRDTFELEELSDRTEMTDLFYTIEFEREEYDVTYGMLVKAYNRIIRPVLDEKLNEICEYMNKVGIEYDANVKDNFKIALVGGFCNFYLTQEQIEQFFHRGAGDKRFNDIIKDRRDCEKAISYGAALIAEGVIGFRQLAPYTLGIAKGDENVIDVVFPIVNQGEELVYGEPMFVKYDNEEKMLLGGTSIPMFYVSCEGKDIRWGKPLSIYREKLTLDERGLYYIGLSLDRSMNLTLHTESVDVDTGEVKEKKSIKLAGVYEILGDLVRVRRL